jgi:hypothetical protein
MMMIESYQKVGSSLPVISRLSTLEWESILTVGEETVYPKNSLIIEQGTYNHYIFKIKVIPISKESLSTLEW